jgi:5'(3')-deoxyribonucleotidase
MTKYNEEPVKPIVFIDMDGVLANFCASPMFEKADKIKNNPPRMYDQYFFETLPVIEGALSQVRRLMQSERYEIQILTKPVRYTHYSYSEKAAWVWKWFPELGEKLTLTQNKTLLAKEGRILIDDSLDEWGKNWENSGGTFFHFNYEAGNHAAQWKEIVDRLLM